MALTGVSILVFRVPFFEILVLSPDWSYLLTVLWVVGMANAINLVDGLDGLAAGIVAIASAAFFLYAIRLGNEDVLDPSNPGALWAMITLGVCLGFLPHNVHPARIFMGDGGALLLGIMMAASTMSVGGRSSAEFSGQAFFFFAPIFIPLVILGVPILDTVWAILRRAARGSSMSAPDKKHLHHRLMNLGHGHRRAVFILWLWTALLSAFVLYPTYTGDGDALVPIGIAALLLALFTLLHPRLRLLMEDVDEAALDALD
jgi:UDP-GlcNAc:undecaprenyl-phosphate GlcNAc-1-phosphate transferase